MKLFLSTFLLGPPNSSFCLDYLTVHGVLPLYIHSSPTPRGMDLRTFLRRLGAQHRPVEIVSGWLVESVCVNTSSTEK